MCACAHIHAERERERWWGRESSLCTLGALVSTLYETRLIIAHSYKRFSRIEIIHIKMIWLSITQYVSVLRHCYWELFFCLENGVVARMRMAPIDSYI